MCSHEAESDRKHLYDITHGDGRLLTGIGGQPQEDTVEATDTKLQGGDGHRETSLSTASIEGELVGDVVVVVSVTTLLLGQVKTSCSITMSTNYSPKVPQGKVDQEAEVKRTGNGSRSSSTSTRGFICSGALQRLQKKSKMTIEMRHVLQ